MDIHMVEPGSYILFFDRYSSRSSKIICDCIIIKPKSNKIFLSDTDRYNKQKYDAVITNSIWPSRIHNPDTAQFTAVLYSKRINDAEFKEIFDKLKKNAELARYIRRHKNYIFKTEMYYALTIDEMAERTRA